MGLACSRKRKQEIPHLPFETVALHSSLVRLQTSLKTLARMTCIREHGWGAVVQRRGSHGDGQWLAVQR
jgi:hypothetical protein